MSYAILLQQRKDGKFEASVPVIPGLTSVGAMRDETLNTVRDAIKERLSAAELVYVDVPNQPASTTNPWLATAGVFADDPTLETMLQEIYAARDVE